MTRSHLITGTILGGLVGGVSLSMLRTVSADPGPGDPPVIVLPSAKAAAKAPVKAAPTVDTAKGLVVPSLDIPAGKPPIKLVQNTEPAKSPVEILPPPSTVEPPKAAPVAPPLLVPTTPPNVKAEAPPVVRKEEAPVPRNESAKPVEVLPTPSTVAAPGDPTMKLAPAMLVPMMAAATPAATAADVKPVIEKITDYAKSDDVTALKTEIETLRKQLATLAGVADVKALKDEIATLKKELANPGAAKTTDVKALKDEIALLKKELANPDAAKTTDVKALKDEIAGLKKDLASLAVPDTAKGADVKTLKDEIAGLKKEITTLAAVKPVDTSATTKAEIESLRKDVSALNTFLRETLDGKVERGFSHDGIVKRLQKLDDSLDTLTKKVASIDGKVEQKTTSAYTATPEKAGLNQGTVSVVNAYPVGIEIVINGNRHLLEPNTIKNVVVPQGSFKYQLVTSGGAETERTIKENETVTLTIK